MLEAIFFFKCMNLYALMMIASMRQKHKDG